MMIAKLDIPKEALVILSSLQGNYRFSIDIDNQPPSLLSDDKCPHRGGPLHLCYKDKSGTLRCPWHDNPKPKNKSHSSGNILSAVGFKSLRTVTVVDSNSLNHWHFKFHYPFN